MPEPNTGCWLWMGLVSARYGYFWLNNKSKRAHRVSYELFNGPITAGLQVLHRCDCPICVNPQHLFLGTPKDNINDMVQKNRKVQVYGELHGSAKLSDKDIPIIRESKKSGSQLARDYGVSRATISMIRSKKIWCHVV